MNDEVSAAPANGGPRRSGAGERLRWIGGIAISALFLWIALGQVGDLRLLTDALARARYEWLVPAIACYLVGLWVRALRWRLLIAPIQALPFGSVFGVLSIGFLVNNVLPARLGELARAVLLAQRHGISRSATLATVVVERVFDGVVILLLLGIATATASGRVGAEWLSLLVPITALGFGGAALALVLLAFAPRLTLDVTARLLAPFSPTLRAAALGIAEKFIAGLGVLQDLKLAGLVLVTSSVAWLFEAGAYFAIGQAFGLMTDPIAYLLAVSVANLGTMIPSSPGYVGTFDALVARSLGVYAVPNELALAYAFVLHFAIWLPPTLIGLSYLWRYNVSLSRVTRD